MPIWRRQTLRLLNQPDPLIGLDIGSQTIKVAQLLPKRGNWHLQNCGVKSLPWPAREEEGEGSEMAIEVAIRELVQEGALTRNQVACSIKGPSVMVKYIQVPNMTGPELGEHLGWEMDQYIPSDVNNIHWDYQIVDHGNQEASNGLMSVLLVAVKKEAVQKRVELIQRSGLQPVVMDVDAIALSNMYAFNYDSGDSEEVLLVHVSPSGVDMSVIKAGIPIFMREIEVWGDEYKNLMERIVRNGQTDKSSVDPVDLSDFSERILKEISKEVNKIIEYCLDMVPPLQIQKLFLGGGYSRIPGLAKTLEVEVDRPLELINPLKKLDVLSKLKGRDSIRNFKSLGGVAIGLALRAFDDG